jgi:DNA-directed RNA polymerase subunit K/omega
MNSAAYTLNGNPIMTHYEFTRLRGIRLQQLEDGSEPFVKIQGHETFSEIFEKEAKNKKLPFIIHRTFNDKTTSYNASNMEINFNKM